MTVLTPAIRLILGERILFPENVHDSVFRQIHVILGERAFFSGLALTLLLGAPLIWALRALSYRQYAYEDAPSTHSVKTGTPTMGGLLFVAALGVAWAWARCMLAGMDPWFCRSAGAVVLLGIACAAIGCVDDLAKIRGARNRGLRGPVKFALTVLVGIFFLWYIQTTDAGVFAAFVPPLRGWSSAVLLWAALSLLVVLATTHAVNLTDGLDGLAAGTIVPPLLFVGGFAAREFNEGVFVVDLALLGSVLGFLAYNRYPAKLFMGDTGALLLGGVLAGSVIITGTHLLLPLVGGVFAAEALSVIIQVVYFKKTGKRVFRMSPLHHHFELCGQSETAVTRSFWVASALCTLVGLALVGTLGAFHSSMLLDMSAR